MALVDRALEGKVALVTGASRGIGRAIARALGARGARVVLTYTSREDLAREAAAEVDAAGGKGSLCKLELADAPAIEPAVKALVDEAGGLDILVNNAGISIDALLLRTRPEDWDRTISVNLTGAFLLCKAASRYLLKAREAGRIVNLTSVVGETGSAGQVAYAASKAGLIGLTRSLARELASRGVTVNAVSPGFIETDMTAASVTGEHRARLLGDIPLGRTGRPEEVADVVAFLCGPEGAYVTGQVIRINGGLFM